MSHKTVKLNIVFILLTALFFSCTSKQEKITQIFLIGDSTVADYANNYDPGKDYYKTRYPVTGWGQVFQELFVENELKNFKHLFDTDSVLIDNRARGGRSTRSFFEEGRWRSVYEQLKPGDLVLMQFGHNDAAVNKVERYVSVDGYKEYLRMYVLQTRAKQAVPVILTPVCRNYPWKDGRLENIHGEYPQAAKEVAEEMEVFFIDLNQLSMDAFSEKGQDYVSSHYFMNLPAGLYEAYPDGQSDNTHFQPEGAEVVAALVFEAMKSLK
ncbi:MAG: rhamnogalacturonan acetylesterase [Bacteroidales bacterium]|jgi:lysophospholipase L1-like esterase|nr:rhamnogalacturonan acetylesterase [Bacteroidales bacterium]MDD4361929.1 rhamnogalacturonan acetylesterase [Bacteroidales bacterium]MDD4431134.1 rhamnogalacturonan acetylesterase [Bacteroidales bacterium]